MEVARWRVDHISRLLEEDEEQVAEAEEEEEESVSRKRSG